MNTNNLSPTRYNGLAISLHWLSAILVIGAILLIETKGWFPKGSELRDAVRSWHFQVGAIVLLATAVRVLWMLAARRPEPIAAKGSLERRLGASAHGLLYLLLLALPLSGAMILIAAGNPVSLLGWPLPVSLDGTKEAAKSVKKIHELFGNAMIAMIALHLVAALWHQFARKDGLMQRMLPQRDKP
ncbi:MAG: superoxide oxidase [Pseudomonadota bacterium]|nr:superoxide oxidase [Pseudomonadota bacterium]